MATEIVTTKKPVYKKWWFWVIVIVIILISRMGEKKNQQATSQNQNQQVTATTAAKARSDIKPTPDITRHDFATKCGEKANHAYFEQSCKGKTVLLKGVITDIDSYNNYKVKIDFGDDVSWHVDLDDTTPHYEKGTRVEFSATLDKQMGWGAHMENGHYWSKLSDTSAAEDQEKIHISDAKKQEAMAAINRFISEGLIQKVVKISNDDATVWVEPKFYLLPFDLKNGLVSWVYLAHFKDKNGFVVVIDGYSGNAVGSYSLKFGNGLKMKK